jgi:hypothetical protein
MTEIVKGVLTKRKPTITQPAVVGFAVWHHAHARWETMPVGEAWTGEQVAQTPHLIGVAGLVLREGDARSPRNC